ncbi:unnamed protein product, partial [Vitis vinifera]
MVSAWGGYVLYVAYNCMYILGMLLAMQIRFVGFQHVQSGEHMAAMGVFFLMQVFYFLDWVKHLLSDTKLFQAFLRITVTCAVGVGAIALGVGTASGYISPWTGRFYSLLDPTYAKDHIPIIASVSEHQPTAWSSFIMYFAGVMVRLILVATPAMCLISAIAVSATIKNLTQLGLPVPLDFCILGYSKFDTSNALISLSLELVFLLLLSCLLLLTYDDNIFYDTNNGTLYSITVHDSLIQTSLITFSRKRQVSFTQWSFSFPLTKIIVWTFTISVCLSKNGKRDDWLSFALYGKTRKRNTASLDQSLPFQRNGAIALLIGAFYLLCKYATHCTWVTSEAYSSPSIVLAARGAYGNRVIFDDYREAYFWLRQNTPPDAKVMSWWDYGYQITAMGNRTVIVDNNTWNNTHIATVGRAMSSYEDEAYEIMRSLDVDYVLVVFGGVTGYSSDDINKFLWMVRIGGGVFPVIKEPDYLVNGEYRVDKGAAPKMLNCLMYKLSYYRFGELQTEYGKPPGYDRARGVEIGNKDIKLEYLEEAFTTSNWIVRIYKVKPPNNRW